MKLGIITQIRAAGLPEPVAEHAFHESRKWAFDWAFVDYKVAVEREGGTWTGGRHTRGKGYAADATKYSEAAILGWLVIRFTAEQEGTGEVLDLIERALKARGWKRGGTPPPANGDLLTTGDIARLCHCAPRTVAKWVDTGMLAGHRIPPSGDRRVSRANLVAFLRQHEMPIPDELEESTS